MVQLDPYVCSPALIWNYIYYIQQGFRNSASNEGVAAVEEAQEFCQDSTKLLE